MRKTRKKDPTTTRELAVEIVYKTAGVMPKGLGSVYRFTRRRDRVLARAAHDCLDIARPASDDPEALECPWCGRLVPSDLAKLLVALRHARTTTSTSTIPEP